MDDGEDDDGVEDADEALVDGAACRCLETGCIGSVIALTTWRTPAKKLRVFTTGFVTRAPTNRVVERRVRVVSWVSFRIGFTSSRSRITRRRTCQSKSKRIMPMIIDSIARRIMERSRRASSTAHLDRV